LHFQKGLTTHSTDQIISQKIIPFLIQTHQISSMHNIIQKIGNEDVYGVFKVENIQINMK
jgi:hypothetical protein